MVDNFDPISLGAWLKLAGGDFPLCESKGVAFIIIGVALPKSEDASSGFTVSGVRHPSEDASSGFTVSGVRHPSEGASSGFTVSGVRHPSAEGFVIFLLAMGTNFTHGNPADGVMFMPRPAVLLVEKFECGGEVFAVAFTSKGFNCRGFTLAPILVLRVLTSTVLIGSYVGGALPGVTAEAEACE